MNEHSQKQQMIEKIREILLLERKIDYLSEMSLSSLELLFADIDEYIRKIAENQKPIFSTMAFATQFLPNFLVAKLSQEMLTPYIVGQVTNHFKPKEAARIALHFRKDFLGEVAIHADKNQVALITQELPFDVACQVMMEMVRKDYFARLGELADLLPVGLLVRFLMQFEQKAHLQKILEHMKDTELIQAVLKKIGLETV